jgi:hypothetical protein
MSADIGLKENMKNWSKGNSERYAKWMNELKDCDIEDMDTLRIRLLEAQHGESVRLALF